MQIEYLEKKINKTSNEDSKKKSILEKEKSAYLNNIDPDISSMYSSICTVIPNELKTYIANNFDTAIPEMIEDYRLTLNASNISRDGIFSIDTIEVLNKQSNSISQQNNKTTTSISTEDR